MRESLLPFLLRFSSRKGKRQIPRSSHFTSHPLPLFLCRIYCINKDRRHRSEERERLTQAAPSFSLHWIPLSAGAPWTVVGSTGSKQAGPPPPHQHQRRHLKSTRLPRKDSWVRPLLLRCGVPFGELSDLFDSSALLHLPGFLSARSSSLPGKALPPAQDSTRPLTQ